MNDFYRPTPEEFDVLARDQKLDGLQAHELGLVLYHVDEDLKEYRKRREGRKPRRELVRRLKRFADLFNDLEYEIDRSRKTMADFLPLDAQEEIGQLMSYGAIEAALNRKIPSRDLKSEIESLTMDAPNFRMAELEERLEYERQAIGLKNGAELLAYLSRRSTSQSRPGSTSIDLTKAAGRQRPWSATTFSFGLRPPPQPSWVEDLQLRRMAPSFGFA